MIIKLRVACTYPRIFSQDIHCTGLCCDVKLYYQLILWHITNLFLADYKPDEWVKHLDNAMAKTYSIPSKQLDSEQWIQKQLYNLKFNKNTYS